MAMLKNLNIEHARAAAWLDKVHWMIISVPESMYREVTQSTMDRGLCGGSVWHCAADWYCGDSFVILRK